MTTAVKMNPQQVTTADDQMKMTNSIRVILVVGIGMTEFFSILCSYRVVGWFLPEVQSENNDDEFPKSSDLEGIEFFWFLVIVVVVSFILQCLFIGLLASLVHLLQPCRKRPPFAEAERNVESNALHFVGNEEAFPPSCLASILEDDCSNHGACSFEATCHLVGDQPYYSAQGNLTIRRIDHPSQDHRHIDVEDRKPLYFSLSGYGQDTEGPFRIEHGRLSPSGIFFWIQTPVTPILGGCLGFKVRRKPQRRLVTGLLDTDGTSVRRGHWEKDSGEGDGYTRFVIKSKKTNTHREETQVAAQ